MFLQHMESGKNLCSCAPYLSLAWELIGLDCELMVENNLLLNTIMTDVRERDVEHMFYMGGFHLFLLFIQHFWGGRHAVEGIITIMSSPPSGFGASSKRRGGFRVPRMYKR